MTVEIITPVPPVHKKAKISVYNKNKMYKAKIRT